MNILLGGFIMKNRQRLQQSLADVLSQKISAEQNFAISAQSRFGTSPNEVFSFDWDRKIIYLDYSQKNNYGQTVWFHKVREFIRLNMVIDIQNNIKLNVLLIPQNLPDERQTASALHFDFFATGIVEKVI